MKEAAELKEATDHYHAQPLEVSGCSFCMKFMAKGFWEIKFRELKGGKHGCSASEPLFSALSPSSIIIVKNQHNC